MRKWSAILIVLAFLFIANGPGAQAYTNVDFSLSFHDGLRPYGSFVNVSHYGNCWRPSGAGFRPYVNGYWDYTDYGPTWVGYEPYAWSVYHYGQWVYDPYYGWVWVPGYDWHAGRVRWAYGADYIGWAPDYRGFDASNINLWVFIDRNNFGDRNYSNVVLRRDMVRNLFDRRVVSVRSGRFQRAELERIVGRPIRVARVQERTILADGRRARLVVPEGHEDILTRVSAMSKTRGNSAKEKVSSSRKVEVKHESRGKSVYESKSKVHTSSKPTVKHESSGKSVHESKSKVHTSSKPSVKYESRGKSVHESKSKVQSPTKSKSSYSTKSQGHSSGTVKKSEAGSKHQTAYSKTSGKNSSATSTQKKSVKRTSKPSHSKPH